jgi:hypothetical protein
MQEPFVMMYEFHTDPSADYQANHDQGRRRENYQSPF